MMSAPNASIRSTAVPGFSLLGKGGEIDLAGVQSVTVEFAFSCVPKARIVISDGSIAKQDFEQSGTAAWAIGEEIEIKMGYAQQHTTVFSGVVVRQYIQSGSGYNSVLNIELRHQYYRSTLNRNNGVFLKKKDSEIMEELLGKYAFRTSIDDTRYQNEQMVQFNCSDWDFVNLRAGANALFVLPKNTGFEVRKISRAEGEKISLQYGTNIEKVELQSDSRLCFPDYAATSWNPGDQENVSTSASAQAINSLGQKSAAQLASAGQHSKKNITAVGSVTNYEAEQMANSALQIADLGKITGTVKCQGTTEVVIGDWIGLSGLGAQFNGKALVTGVLQELSDGLWYTTFQVGIPAARYADRFDDIEEKPASGLLPSLHGLQIGIVSKIVSDNNDEKILVSLPNVKAGEDAVWARCARIDAAKDRGFIFRPEAGDEVILGFIDNDPRQAIILGSLHSAKNTAPDDLKADDKNKYKGLISREKLKVIFDDDKKIIRVETPLAKIIINDDEKSISISHDNNTVELSDAGIKLSSKKDIQVKADGDIKLEGKNVTIKAQSSFAAEGASGAKVNSNGTLDLKGAMVNIN